MGFGFGKYHSAEYQCHNFLNQVLYSQILKKIPKDAIIIEVAPDGLFQAILRRALEPSITKLHLVQKHCEDIYNFFWMVLYVEGCHPNFCLLNEKQKNPSWSKSNDAISLDKMESFRKMANAQIRP
ncbi:hypothetical protein NQ317_008469 [Molorchus minor]|uniref:Uncharacterized protein n=1 Tax=Molorchus minor TaxID=1323400 RepID=A0ABQ9JE13_9CUCU|nr:hypothetical protein NQ317_008469 [Molorchus minor]